MNGASPETRALAERLIASEARKLKASKQKVPLAFPVCEKLRPQLATLMGSTGFHALLSRALTVARGEVPWLHKVQVQP